MISLRDVLLLVIVVLVLLLFAQWRVYPLVVTGPAGLLLIVVLLVLLLRG